jgi:hypothetical protein
VGRALGIAVAALVIAAAIVVANIVLVGYVGGRNDQVGNLSPVTSLATTVPPPPESDEGGRGRAD